MVRAGNNTAPRCEHGGEWSPRQLRFQFRMFLHTGLAVPMSMMQIGIVRMLMSNTLMPMPVRMRLGYRFIVFVLVVFVMHMAVIMRQNIVLVVVLMALGQMQPKTAAH